jgi:hypothetical protein
LTVDEARQALDVFDAALGRLDAAVAARQA